MFVFFIIRKLFDISCIRPVQPISKPLSVVLAECGHFVVTCSVHVVTWSVQEYSCTVLCYYVVCAGIILHYPVFTQVCAGICRARTLWSMCMLMHELSGSIFKAVCARARIFHSQFQKELAMASSETSTSRLPEEDSFRRFLSDNEVSQIDIDSQISTSIRSSKSAKKWSCVYRREYRNTFPWATTSRKGSFSFCLKCSRDINLGRGGKDLDRRQETKSHKRSEIDGEGVLLYILLWANKRGVYNPCRSTLRIFPWRAPSCLSIGRSLSQTIQVNVSQFFYC